MNDNQPLIDRLRQFREHAENLENTEATLITEAITALRRTDILLDALDGLLELTTRVIGPIGNNIEHVRNMRANIKIHSFREDV